MPTIRIVNYPVYYPVKSDNPPDNPPDRPPERRWPWSASARLPPSTTLGATFKQGRTRSRCHLDYFGNGTARRRNTAVTVRKGMGGGSRTEVAVRRFAPYPASSTRSAPPLCVAWLRSYMSAHRVLTTSNSPAASKGSILSAYDNYTCGDNVYGSSVCAVYGLDYIIELH